MEDSLKIKTFFECLIGVLALVAVANQASALTPSYNSNATPVQESSSTDFGLSHSISTGTIDSPTFAFTDAALTLTGSVGPFIAGVPLSYTIATMKVGGIYQLYFGTLTFSGGSETISLANGSNGLHTLNTYLNSNSPSPLTFSLETSGAAAILAKASLDGHTVAPEPTSLALVCAGLVALPFARRLRKAIAARS